MTQERALDPPRFLVGGVPNETNDFNEISGENELLVNIQRNLCMYKI